jgi:nifR3 family TIM-barrel protein
MISSEGIIRLQPKSLAMVEFHPDERPIGIQLFGADPEVMQQAARLVVQRYNPDVIDINFGCPARKIVEGNGGAAVLKDLVLTEEIIRATVEGAADTPVTIKIRTGWDDRNPVYTEVGRIAERAGVKAVTLHARSRQKGFSGTAEWTTIKRLKESVSIPVIGNGDIRSPADAGRMLDMTGCDAVMIGRAAVGNPFIFRRTAQFLASGIAPGEPTVADKINMALLHTRLMVEQYGPHRGIVMMRRCLTWYVKGFPGASELRNRLTLATTEAEVRTILNSVFESEPDPAQ